MHSPDRDWTIRVASNQHKRKISKAGVRKIVSAILALMSDPSLPASITELSVTFVDDEKMRELNSNYRGIDKATDVLSFSQLEGAGSPLVQSLGDIVISVEYAAREAKKRRLPLQEELLRLLAHGALHLLGYEHEGVPPSTRQRMKRKENKLEVELRKRARQILK